jgi:hypothetical protein
MISWLKRVYGSGNYWLDSRTRSINVDTCYMYTTLGTRESPANNLCILPPATNEHVMSIWHLQKAMILKHLPKEQSLSTLPRGHASIKLHTRTSKQLACLTHTEACMFFHPTTRSAPAGSWGWPPTSWGIDVDQRCQAASNGGVAGGQPKLRELCMAKGSRRRLPVPAGN